VASNWSPKLPVSLSPCAGQFPAWNKVEPSPRATAVSIPQIPSALAAGNPEPSDLTTATPAPVDKAELGWVEW